MIFENILVPYDGSSHAREALDVAIEFVQGNSDAKLHIVNVISSADLNPKYGDTNPFWKFSDTLDFDRYNAMMKETHDSAVKDLEKDLHPLIERLGNQVTVDIVVSAGTAQGITDYAKREDCDLIIMGRRGMGGLRGMLGSVSYSVLSGTDIPVLCMK